MIAKNPLAIFAPSHEKRFPERGRVAMQGKNRTQRLSRARSTRPSKDTHNIFWRSERHSLPGEASARSREPGSRKRSWFVHCPSGSVSVSESESTLENAHFFILFFNAPIIFFPPQSSFRIFIIRSSKFCISTGCHYFEATLLKGQPFPNSIFDISKRF